MSELTEDQKWCIAHADKASALKAPTVEALLRDAAIDPDRAAICRQEMNRAALGARLIREG